SEETVRVQEPLGLLQAARDRPGGRGIPAHGPGRLPPSQEESALIRRSFAAIAVLALVGVLPSPAGAQRTGPPHRVGVLNDARAANHPTVDGLKAGLRDLGFEEGRDVVFDVELTDGNPERIPAAAGALVKSGVDVIFTSSEAATLAAKVATQTIPI